MKKYDTKHINLLLQQVKLVYSQRFIDSLQKNENKLRAKALLLLTFAN